jgi:hypothetical protein
MYETSVHNKTSLLSNDLTPSMGDRTDKKGTMPNLFIKHNIFSNEKWLQNIIQFQCFVGQAIEKVDMIGSVSAAIQHYYKGLRFIKSRRDKYPYAEIAATKYQLEIISISFANVAAEKDIKPVIDNRNR